MKLFLTIIIDFFLSVSRLADYKDVSPPANVSQTDWLKEKCQNNGGSEAFNNMDIATGQFQNCVAAAAQLNVTNLNPMSLVGTIQLAPYVCSKKAQIQTCFHTYADTVQACFDAEERKSINTAKQIFTGVTDYVCQNSGREISSFAEGPAAMCFGQNRQHLSNCISVLKDHKTKFMTQDFYTKDDLDNIMNFLKFDAEKCSNITKAEQCVAKEMETCNSYPNWNFVTNLLAAAKKGTPCSGSSWASSVPSAMMFVVTLSLAYLPSVYL